MTREDKELLLLKDLCARLPYGVMAKFGDSNPTKITNITQCIDSNSWFVESEGESDGMCCPINNVKPYLFPLSNMSEEQKYEFYLKFIAKDCDFDYFKFHLDNGKLHKLLTSLLTVEEIIDWFHKNHVDWRGLIPMGLAEDATWLNIY